MKNSRIIIWILTGIEGLLYISFLAMDMGDMMPELANGLKMASIIICCLIAWLVFLSTRSVFSLIIALALCFTVFADRFLLFEVEGIWPGVLSFCIAHLLYMGIISVLEIKRILAGAGIRIVIAAALFLLIRENVAYDGMTLFLLSLYAASFFLNVVCCGAGLVRKSYADLKDIEMRVFLAGLCLFVMCDICVALYNLSGSVMDLDRVPAIYTISRKLMWAFYLPSQLLIVHSTLRIKNRTNNINN